MRVEFSNWLYKYLFCENSSVFLTGDLGFNAFEKIQNEFGNKFINVGVAEQNMINIAAGLADQGFSPICYSIAPFIVFRPLEQIRLNVSLHNMNVKLVGNGGGYGYGIMGATHHALEDIAVLSSMPNMRCILPVCDEDVVAACNYMTQFKGPAYLRLNVGSIGKYGISPPQFEPFRKIKDGNKVVCVTMGTSLLTLLEAIDSSDENDICVYSISELPVFDLPFDFLEKVRECEKVIFIEEHVQFGGIATFLTYFLAKNGVSFEFEHLCGKGYLTGTYGTQKYHQLESQLDAESIKLILKKMGAYD